MHERLMKSISTLDFDCSFALTASQSLNPNQLILINHAPTREAGGELRRLLVQLGVQEKPTSTSTPSRGKMKWRNRLRGCLVPLLFQKNLNFGSSFCKMQLNTMQKFWQKMVILHFGFWPQEAKKKPKRVSWGPHEGNKFCILDGTKDDPENFGILHSTIPK